MQAYVKIVKHEAEMLTISEKVEGDQEYSEPVTVTGMLVGEVTLLDGCTMMLNGMIIGNLKAHPGSKVKINGTVQGTVINLGGTVEVYGIVARIEDHAPTASTFVHPKAVIRNR